jgi:cell volume regulation protein A
MQVVMFLTLGLLVFPSRIIPIAGFGLAVSLVLMLVARPLGVYISLIFFRINFREKLFISWVGLRGAVPIILATYPLIAGLPSSEMIFNVVFFISATSVLLQGMTLATVARWLHVYVPDKIRRRSQLEIELSDGTKSELTEIILHEHSPCLGKPIVELHFPPNALIVMIKRNNKFITPNGATELQAGDKLTIMAEDRHALDEVLLITGI